MANTDLRSGESRMIQDGGEKAENKSHRDEIKRNRAEIKRQRDKIKRCDKETER